MRVTKATLMAAVATSCLSATTTAFAPSRAAIITGAPSRVPSKSEGVYCPPLSAGPPVIGNWRYEPSKGTISGTVTNHPTIKDGDRITTSPVQNPGGVNENLLVVTKSGSKYKLSKAAIGAMIPAKQAQLQKEKEAKNAAAKTAAAEKKRLADEKRAAAAEAKKAAAESKKAAAAESKKAAAESKKAAAEAKKAAAAEAKKPAPAPKAAVASKKPVPAPKAAVASKKPVPAPKAAVVSKKPAPKAAAAPQVDAKKLRQLAKSTFSLTGATVGPNGKYLLAGKPRQSSGRAAKIWDAYVAGDISDVPAGFDNGNASGVKKITIKLSPDIDRMRLENSNYDKVQSGLFSGRFVKKIEYIQYVESNKRDLDRKVSALVIESGVYDLKALLNARKGAPLRGRALRDAAASAGQCIQAVHSSNLVWTDLKTENFVVVNYDNLNKEVSDTNGGMGLPGVKGIDLESVIAKGGNPIDYSPEACPPEFAVAYMGGYGEDFVLDQSYDMWSLGMMLYELSVGKPYFDKKAPTVVTMLLCDEAFEADLSEVPDKNLRDLIGKCLSLDSRKRPDITGFLLHPYFITTGFGAFSF